MLRPQGPAVWALRAQTDKLEYAACMRRVLEATPGLSIREAMVTGLDLNSNDEVTGVTTFFGMRFAARAVVLTTGTFMNGRIWVGRASMAAGRAGEAPSAGLTEALVSLGFETDRLKTGTPARVDSRTVEFSGLEEQPGAYECVCVYVCECVRLCSQLCTCTAPSLLTYLTHAPHTHIPPLLK